MYHLKFSFQNVSFKIFFSLYFCFFFLLGNTSGIDPFLLACSVRSKDSFRTEFVANPICFSDPFFETVPIREN
jgi:hypothetical protein